MPPIECRFSAIAPTSAVLVFLILAILAASAPALAARPEAEAAAAAEEGVGVVEDLVAAFNSKDVDRIMSFFAPDAIYHNMPGEPVQGTEAVRGAIASYVNAAAVVDWEILSSAQVGSTVLTERIDRFVFGDKKVALPVMGAFDVQDGKIVAWRDYFDQATWTRQMAD